MGRREPQEGVAPRPQEVVAGLRQEEVAQQQEVVAGLRQEVAAPQQREVEAAPPQEEVAAQPQEEAAHPQVEVAQQREVEAAHPQVEVALRVAAAARQEEVAGPPQKETPQRRQREGPEFPPQRETPQRLAVGAALAPRVAGTEPQQVEEVAQRVAGAAHPQEEGAGVPRVEAVELRRWARRSARLTSALPPGPVFVWETRPSRRLPVCCPS